MFSNRVLRISRDSMLVATDNGLYQVGTDAKYRKLEDALLNTASYMSMAVLGKYYLLATSNKGFIVFNSQTGTSPAVYNERRIECRFYL